MSWRAEFVRFLAVGGIAAAANVASRIGFDIVMPYEVAIIAAYLVGMTLAFILNRAFVFARSGRAAHREYARFALVNLAAVAQVWLVSVGLARLFFPWIGMTWHPDTVAHMIGVALPVFTSYFGHKYFSFAGAR